MLLFGDYPIKVGPYVGAPEPKADRQYRIGAPGERLLPGTSDCKRVVLRHGALPATTGVDRYPGELNKTRVARPPHPTEDSVAGRNQRALGDTEDANRLVDAVRAAPERSSPDGYTFTPRR